jgi:hypothetical protein
MIGASLERSAIGRAQLPVAIGLFMFEQVNLFTDCFSIGEYSDTGWLYRSV